MSWLLIDNVTPNNPHLINLERVDAIRWDSGTLTFCYSDGVISMEAAKEEFIKIAQKLNILEEIE